MTRLRRRSLLVATSALPLLVAIGTCLFVAYPADPVGLPLVFKRIQKGKSKLEVVAIRGPPTEGYFPSNFQAPKAAVAHEAGVWQWPRFGITVWYDADEVVVHTAWKSADKGVLARLRDWAGF